MLSYTASGAVFVPEIQVKAAVAGHSYKALRGYCSCLAVFLGGQCIGWIDTRLLGYNDAKAYLQGVQHVST